MVNVSPERPFLTVGSSGYNNMLPTWLGKAYNPSQCLQYRKYFSGRRLLYEESHYCSTGRVNAASAYFIVFITGPGNQHTYMYNAKVQNDVEVSICTVCLMHRIPCIIDCKLFS